MSRLSVKLIAVLAGAAFVAAFHLATPRSDVVQAAPAQARNGSPPRRRPPPPPPIASH